MRPCPSRFISKKSNAMRQKKERSSNAAKMKSQLNKLLTHLVDIQGHGGRAMVELLCSELD